MVSDKKSRQGSSRSYADRAAKGRPNKTYSLPQETVDQIEALAAMYGKSHSQVVVMAVDLLAASKR